MAYLRLLWMYYDTEQAIANDADAVAFKIGAIASDVAQIFKHFFFLHDDGLWHHSRCDKEILAFRVRSEKAKNSANARWENAEAMRTHSDRNANGGKSDANQEPITNNHKPSNKIRKATAFQRPTLSELIAEFNCRVPDPQAQAAKFLNYYESNGWKVGRNAMKSWPHAVTNWITNSQSQTTPSTRRTTIIENANDQSWAEGIA
jgi:uncharacterized protein YdaU (DUF1376 family)